MSVFLVILFSLVFIVLALLVFIVLVSLVFAAEKTQKQFNITLLTLTIADLDIESRLSEHLSTSHPVSIILIPKPLFCVPLRRCFSPNIANEKDTAFPDGRLLLLHPHGAADEQDPLLQPSLPGIKGQRENRPAGLRYRIPLHLYRQHFRCRQ